MSNPKMIRLILSCLTQAIDSVIEKDALNYIESMDEKQLTRLALEFEKQKIKALKSFFLETTHGRYIKQKPLHNTELVGPRPNLPEDYQTLFNKIRSMIDTETLQRDSTNALRYVMFLKAAQLGALIIALSMLSTILTLVLLHVASPPAAFFAIPFILSCLVLVLSR